MGMFDSYNVPWQGSPREIQTKRLENVLDHYAMGDYIAAISQEESQATSSLVIFVEEHCPSSYYLPQSLRLHVQLVHHQGIFVDACFHPTKCGAQSAQGVLHKNWSNPARKSVLLQKLLFHKSLKEKEAQYKINKIQKLSNAYKTWQEQKADELLPDGERSKKKSLFFLAFHLKEYDFETKSFEEYLNELLKSIGAEQAKEVLRDAPEALDPSGEFLWDPQWKSNQMALIYLCESLQLEQLRLFLLQNPSLLEEKDNVLKIKEALMDASTSVLMRNDWARFVLTFPKEAFLYAGPCESEAYHYVSWAAIQGLDIALFEKLLSLCVEQKNYKALLNACEFVCFGKRVESHGSALLKVLDAHWFSLQEQQELIDLCLKEGGLPYAQCLLEQGFMYHFETMGVQNSALISLLEKKQVSISLGMDTNEMSAEEQFVLAWARRTKNAVEFLKTLPIQKSNNFEKALCDMEKGVLEQSLVAIQEDGIQSAGPLRL